MAHRIGKRRSVPAKKGPVINGMAAGADGIGGLSLREREVFRLLGGGATIKEIARALGLEYSTVTTYHVRLMRKFGVPTRHKLLVAAIRQSVLDELSE